MWSFFNALTNRLLLQLEKHLPDFARGQTVPNAADLHKETPTTLKQTTLPFNKLQASTVPAAVEQSSCPDAFGASPSAACVVSAGSVVSDGEDSEGDCDVDWVACDACGKWRTLPSHMEPDMIPATWSCSDGDTWRKGLSCDVPEDQEDDTPTKPVRKRKKATPGPRAGTSKAGRILTQTKRFISPPPSPVKAASLTPPVDESTLSPSKCSSNKTVSPPPSTKSPILVAVATAIEVVTRKRDAELAMGPATRVEGHLRREMVEIVSLVHNTRGLTQHWASHNARGAFQERAIAKMREVLLPSLPRTFPSLSPSHFPFPLPSLPRTFLSLSPSH